MDYLEKEIVSVAKRDNNPKRNFLLVNAHQGKHFPATPHQVFAFVEALTKRVFETPFDEPILIVGFAETATAIGAIVAALAPTDVNYIHTTREPLPAGSYLYFTEAHSHATEQKLIMSDLEACLEDGTRILFAEDEVTTGNTIENIIRVLEETFPHKHLRYGIVSLLNAMPQNKIDDLAKRDIPCHFMIRIPHCDYDALLNRNSYPENLRFPVATNCTAPYTTLELPEVMNPRNIVNALAYESGCNAFANTAIAKLSLSNLRGKKILVLGTEECMYPGLMLGSELEKSGNHVIFHATTRSPILPCEKEGYPIFSRHTLPSFYDKERTTFLYNMATYDYAFIVTDAQIDTGAMDCLSQVLLENDCHNIFKITWR